MLKKLFNAFSGPRFIDIHGRPWHRTRDFISDADRYFLISGSLGLASLFYAAAVTPQMLALDALVVSSNLMMCAFNYILLGAPLLPSQNASLNSYAIDREGRAFPPDNLPTLLARTKTYKQHAVRGFLATSSLLTMAAIPLAMGDVSLDRYGLPALGTQESLTYLKDHFSFVLAMAIPLTLPFGYVHNIRRANKILNGEYVFCGKPPAEPKKESKGVLAGVAKPSMS